jgi:hypothetical protein
VLATIVCGVVVLAQWSHLSKRWIALGLLPWAVILFEVTLVVLALPWNMSGRGG